MNDMFASRSLSLHGIRLALVDLLRFYKRAKKRFCNYFAMTNDILLLENTTIKS